MTYIQSSDLRSMQRTRQIEEARITEDMIDGFTLGGACWFCGCHENGTIEYDDGKIVDCPECNN